MEVFSWYFIIVSLISNYFCVFTAFVLLLYIFLANHKIPTRVRVTHFTYSLRNVRARNNCNLTEDWDNNLPSTKSNLDFSFPFKRSPIIIGKKDGF